MALDPVLLSRLQWAWVIAWHILLPALTVGLASYIAVLEGLYFFTSREIWLRISGFWTKIFAVSFGMGVVSGVIMPFQFGTNWSRFTDATADVLSPCIAISLWPMIVPYHYTLWQAASSESTQAFLLIGTLFLLPVILMYTAWSYWVFRGKVGDAAAYH